MSVKAARVAKFAIAGSRSPTQPSNRLRILNSPIYAEISAAPTSESEAPDRALTFRLPSEVLPLPDPMNAPALLLFSFSSRTRV